jgi:predicted RNA-binding Zn-ribbon protein involved in translation (DUF1610 family)
MAENEPLRRQEAARQTQQAAAAGTIALCKHCGAALDPELSFCPNCGEEAGGEERKCEYCSTHTTKEFCPHCGRRVISISCPKCGTPSINDACENCGAILNPALEAVFTQERPEPAKMSAEESAKIEAEFKALEQNESPEFKAFQKKLIERQILLEERDYFNKREKRVIKAFGSRPFTLELPDPAEEAFRMKAYAGLEKTVIERDQKAIEAELEKMFPPLPPLEKIDDAELKRRRAGAEAERQRWIEIERQKLEQEQRKKMIPGVYYHESHNGMLTAGLRIDDVEAVCNYRCTVCGYAVITYTVSLDGNTVSLIGRAKRGDHCTFHEYNLVENYSGTINNSGTVLTGYWYRNGETVPVTFYKR